MPINFLLLYLQMFSFNRMQCLHSCYLNRIHCELFDIKRYLQITSEQYTILTFPVKSFYSTFFGKSVVFDCFFVSLQFYFLAFQVLW